MADHYITEQLSLMNLWECPVCRGAGVLYGSKNPEDADRCPMCQGAGTLDFDPEDKSVIPF